VHHVVVAPRVSKELGQFVTRLSDGRKWLVQILNRLYSKLEEHGHQYQAHRDPDNERHFFYDMMLFEGDAWHRLRFSVDDHQASGYLFVVAVADGGESE
jgi:hypothetical protein